MTARARLSFRLATFREIVTDAPVSYSVYSAFSFYGSRRGGELPGTWLVAALGALGHETAAVRQTLYRMEASRELESRAAGRVKFYRLSAAARAEAEAGLAKIMGDYGEDDAQPWDGEWTLVQFRSGTETQVERERLREVLRAEGFAAMSNGLYLHPRDRSARLLSAANQHGVRDIVEVFRGRRIDGDDDRALVARHWNLDAIAARYESFVERFEPLARGSFAAESAFVLRFAVVFDYLEAAWQDPELASSLLPAKWVGARARRLARDLYKRLLPGALAFGDSLQ